MTYRNWAVAERKEWLPKKGPFVILEEMPQGNPSLQRPDNLCCPSPEAMEGFLKHTSKRMSPGEEEWWKQFLEDERKKRRQWEEMTDTDYLEAGRAFDLTSIKYKTPHFEPETRDEAYKKREKKLKELIEKKNNFPPVSVIEVNLSSPSSSCNCAK